MSKVIGIDLGTTNSCVAVVEGGKPVVITNAEGERTTPSVVAFTKDGERLVGGAAKRQLAANSGRTVSSIKRHMGSDYRVHIDGKDLTPQEISAMILTKIRRDAESYLGEPVTEAVITVPAYFDDSQRKATQDAGRIAGLNVLRIINEPTAAAVAYGLDNEAPQKILVYDLGGGTFDVSIIEIEDGTFTVLATGGDTRLGGDDFDQRIVEYAVAEFKKSDRIDLSRDPAAMGRLKEEAEKAKKELSSALSAQLNLPFIAVGKDGPHHLDLTISRPQFEMMTGDLLARTVAPVQNALRDAGISASQLGKVLLVGGSTRMPAVERQVKELLGCEPSHSLNPDECVAMGAAVHPEPRQTAHPALRLCGRPQRPQEHHRPPRRRELPPHPHRRGRKAPPGLRFGRLGAGQVPARRRQGPRRPLPRHRSRRKSHHGRQAGSGAEQV